MKRQPLSDRDAPVTWAENGGMGAKAHANAKVCEMMVDHPNYLDADARIRAAFEIKLGL